MVPPKETPAKPSSSSHPPPQASSPTSSTRSAIPATHPARRVGLASQSRIRRLGIWGACGLGKLSCVKGIFQMGVGGGDKERENGSNDERDSRAQKRLMLRWCSFTKGNVNPGK